jgi:hypothetical protein
MNILKVIKKLRMIIIAIFSSSNKYFNISHLMEIVLITRINIFNKQIIQINIKKILK